MGIRAAVGVVVVVGAVILSSAAFAEERKDPEDPKAAAPAAETAGKTAPRLVVVKDPETGRLRAATSKELEALRRASPKQAFATAGAPTSVEKLASGRVRARLGPEYMRYSVVQKNPDGSFSSDCVPASKVDGALKASTPAAKNAAEEK